MLKNQQGTVAEEYGKDRRTVPPFCLKAEGIISPGSEGHTVRQPRSPSSNSFLGRPCSASGSIEVNTELSLGEQTDRPLQVVERK